MLPLTLYSYYYQSPCLSTYKGSMIRTCIDEFEVRDSTIELCPFSTTNLGLRGDRTLNQQICNPCVVPYYRLNPIQVTNG